MKEKAMTLNTTPSKGTSSLVGFCSIKIRKDYLMFFVNNKRRIYSKCLCQTTQHTQWNDFLLLHVCQMVIKNTAVSKRDPSGTLMHSLHFISVSPPPLLSCPSPPLSLIPPIFSPLSLFAAVLLFSPHGSYITSTQLIF